MRRPVFIALFIPLITLIQSLTPVQFAGEASVVKANLAISKYTFSGLPRIWSDFSDPNSTAFEDIAASFTEKAFWIRGNLGSGCHANDYLAHNQRIVLLSSLDKSNLNKQKLLTCYSNKLLKLDEVVIQGNQGPYLLVNYSIQK